MLSLQCALASSSVAWPDGDIYGSEGQYIRYEEGQWEGSDVYEDVSSGQAIANPRGRSGSARPSRSFGADRYSDDNMADGNAYATPETTAPLQAVGQVKLHSLTHSLAAYFSRVWPGSFGLTHSFIQLPVALCPQSCFFAVPGLIF